MQHTVHQLQLASVKLAGQFNPPTYADTRINVYGYLILCDSSHAGDSSHLGDLSHVVLVDTGVGEGNEYIDRTFEPVRTTIAAELAGFGLEPNDVTHIVNSHLHFDHCGNNRLFSNAEIFVQDQELAIARSLQTRYTDPSWFDYTDARLNPLCGDHELVPGINLLATPGHTPGHQSVLVSTSNAQLLVAAQAAFTAEEFQRGGDPREQAHDGLADLYVASIAKLKELQADQVYFSHDTRSPEHR